MKTKVNASSPFPEIEKILLSKQRQVSEQLRSIEKSDPINSDSLAEVSEIGTDAWQADVHIRAMVAKNNLLDVYGRISLALRKLKEGTYGRCERCGKNIEADRLEALPTANFCKSCSNTLKSNFSLKPSL